MPSRPGNLLFYPNLNENQWCQVGFCMHVIIYVYTMLESFSDIKSKLIIFINLIKQFWVTKSNKIYNTC